MCPPEHDQTVAPKRAQALQRTPNQEEHAWDGDPSSQALARMRQTTGNAGLLHLLGRHQSSLQRLTTLTPGTKPAQPALSTVEPTSVQREEQDAAAREAGRRERAARREALAARREKTEARKQAREARLAGGQAPAAPPGPGAVAGPQVATGPVPAAGAPAASGPVQAPAGGGAESMAAKLAKWAELQKTRQAALAPTAVPAAAAPAAAAPPAKAANKPDHQMAAQEQSQLSGRLRKVGEPVVYSHGDKKSFLLYRENNMLQGELTKLVGDYRRGDLTDAQFQARRTTWLASLNAFEQKMAAYKPAPVRSRPQLGHGDSAIDITEEGIRRRKQEARWAERDT